MSDMVELLWENTRSKMFHEGDKAIRYKSWSPIRTKVPGGWLVTWYYKGMDNVRSLTFVPDPNHEWK